jgi:hypothetical protein
LFEQLEGLPAASRALAESVVVALEPTVTWIPVDSKVALEPVACTEPPQFACVKSWTVAVSELELPITIGVVSEFEGEAGLVELIVGAVGAIASWV